MTPSGAKVASKRPSIAVVDYDPGWPAAFIDLRTNLERILAGLVLEIHHIGSTSVPGLCAKPKIDVDIVLHAKAVLPDAIERLKAEGYAYHGDPYRSGMWTFTIGRGSHGERLYSACPARRRIFGACCSATTCGTIPTRREAMAR